jgi:hypothetical protein
VLEPASVDTTITFRVIRDDVSAGHQKGLMARWDAVVMVIDNLERLVDEAPVPLVSGPAGGP